MKRISLFILFLLFVTFGCSTANNTNQSSSDSFTVDWNQVEDKPVPKISESTFPSVGPAPLEAETQYKKKPNPTLKPIALILGPGVYRTLSHIALLKEMKLKGQEPQVIMGHGLASVIAAYFAFGYEPDYIEWKFFKFINELENQKPFSKEWIRLAEEKLFDELKDKRIEEGKLTLLIPIKDTKSDKVLFKKRGPLKKYLTANIDPRGLFSKTLRPAFTDSFVDKKPLLNMGVGRIIGVDLLSEGITWKIGSGFLNGVFEKAATVTLKSRAKMDIMITYPLSTFKVDDKRDVADLVFKSKNLAREKLKELKEKE